MHMDADNPYTARKIAHMVEAIGFEPPEDEFFYELAEELENNYLQTEWTVQFRESKDGKNMEVDIFADEGVAIYALEDTVAGKNTPAPAEKKRGRPATKKEEPAAEEVPFEADEEEVEDELLDEAIEELDAELGDDAGDDIEF